MTAATTTAKPMVNACARHCTAVAGNVALVAKAASAMNDATAASAPATPTAPAQLTGTRTAVPASAQNAACATARHPSDGRRRAAHARAAAATKATAYAA